MYGMLAQLRSFTNYDGRELSEYGITEEEYIDYAGHYQNVLEEIKEEKSDIEDEDPDAPKVNPDYELMAYSNTKIDYEYIINLIQNIVTPGDDAEDITPEERQKQIDEMQRHITETV